MIRRIFLLGAIAGAVVADDGARATSTTIRVLHISEGLPKFGSVIGADSTAVTYVGVCGGREDCGGPFNGGTVKQGPSTFSAGQVRSLVASDGSKHTTAGVDCTLNSRMNEASCQYSHVTTDEHGKVTQSTATQILSGYLDSMWNVTLTQGVEKLTAGPDNMIAMPSSPAVDRTSAPIAAPSPTPSGQTATPTAAASETTRDTRVPASPSASSSVVGSVGTSIVTTQPAILAAVLAIFGSLLVLP